MTRFLAHSLFFLAAWTLVIEYLQSRVEPLLESLAATGESVAEAVDAYRNALDPQLGILYRERKLGSIQKMLESVSDADRGEFMRILREMLSNAREQAPHQ